MFIVVDSRTNLNIFGIEVFESLDEAYYAIKEGIQCDEYPNDISNVSDIDWIYAIVTNEVNNG